MEKKKYEKIIISIILIIQTIIFIIVGANKSYIHMDEAYSLGLASYDKVEIQDNENFYNIWHDGKYYEDYLCVNDDEIGQYKQVYENQKNDGSCYSSSDGIWSGRMWRWKYRSYNSSTC